MGLGTRLWKPMFQINCSCASRTLVELAFFRSGTSGYDLTLALVNGDCAGVKLECPATSHVGMYSNICFHCSSSHWSQTWPCSARSNSVSRLAVATMRKQRAQVDSVIRRLLGRRINVLLTGDAIAISNLRKDAVRRCCTEPEVQSRCSNTRR